LDEVSAARPWSGKDVYTKNGRRARNKRGNGVKKILLLVGLIAVLFAALSGIAYAASPQDIWSDYNDNGKLDGTYTTDELNAYLNNATLHQYPPDAGKVQALDTLVRGILQGRNRFPFTGSEALLLGVGVVALLGTGLGLRRLARARG
jgi:hypothetical protein